MENTQPVAGAAPASSVVTIANVVYALHAFSVAVGVFTAATVVGQFLFYWPSLLAVILNYVKRSDARGTWLESHFSWQIRTFWYAVAAGAAVWAISLPLMLVLVGFATLMIGLFVVGLWVAYRVIRGWLRLREGRPI